MNVFARRGIARLLLAVCGLPMTAARGDADQWTVTSPSGNLSVTVIQANWRGSSPPQVRLFYRVRLGEQEALPPSPLGVKMDGPHGDFTTGLSLVGQTDRVIDETYPMPAGKKSVHRNRACEKTLIFANLHGRRMHVIVRAYDDGLAYRYHFPGNGPRQIVAETSGFRVPEGSTGWLQPYRPNYEADYVRRALGHEVGLELRLECAGGVNAVVSKIELFSTEKPPKPVERIAARDDLDPPAGYHLVVCDNCGVSGAEPHCVVGRPFTYDGGHVPLDAVPAGDPARTVSYDERAVVYRLPGLSPTATYKLRTMHLSHDDSRVVSLSANGRVLLDKFALPKQKVITREFDIPPGLVRQIPALAGGEHAFPALFQTPGGVWLLLTEAAVYGDYAGSRLLGPAGGAGFWRVKIPHTVSGTLPWTTPWRVAIVGDRLGTIVESVMVDNLNPPCEVDDTSWIRPGRVTFPWWSDHAASGKFQKLKTFVDLAAEMGWEWIEFDTALVDAGNTCRASDAWMRTPWVPELVKYAREKGVSVYGWDHFRNLDTPEKRERIFGLYNKLGITGVKIDFLDSDAQERFKFRDAAIRDCLTHKLMVSFHGATIPRGQRRRWPHIAAWEAVMGSEWYSFGEQQPNPRLNCTLPFARNVVGPMDSCPVTFTAEKKTTTNAHELALSVIYESAWQCLSDTPEAYAASPGKPFLQHVPVAWDDVHFIDGYPGEFVCLARRKGNDWYIAGICGEEGRNVTVPLDFLEPGTYDVALYRDAAQGREIAVEKVTLHTTTPLEIALPPGGGFCTRVRGGNGLSPQE